MGVLQNELEILTEINENIKKLLAISAIQGKTPEDKLKILHGMGYNSFEIGELTGIPASSVRAKTNKKAKVKK
jgi:hypothetical protein